MKSTDNATEQTPKAADDAPKADGVRETIDSIVVALILAFVFRAFIVEAFVIPTGSMAPSLNGKHGQHRCENCGYAFVYGIRDPIIEQHPNGRGTTSISGTIQNESGNLIQFNLRCPNCTWEGEGNEHLNSADKTVVANSGDRILVLKWPYDIGGRWLGPQRWDVVVFKNPQDGEINFIKRLLGLPGEVLQIIDGDVYAAPIASVPKDIIEALNAPEPAIRQPVIQQLTDAQLLRLARTVKIQRKTRVAQDSLWMLHCDQDFVPRPRDPEDVGRSYDPPRWVERESNLPRAWDASTPVVRFKPTDSAVHWLELTGAPIADEYGYNNVNVGANVPAGTRINSDRAPGHDYVGDVKVSCIVFPTGSPGDGEMILHLQRGPDRFQTRINATGKVVLERFNKSIRDGYWEELRRGEIAPPMAGRPIEIEFQNLDYRVSLSVNGEEVVATDDNQYFPDMDRLLKPQYEDGRSHAQLSIAARTFPCEIRHLKVMRDVYYRADRIDNRRPGWGTATNPILLRETPEDFFCCGDNSPQSKDSRLWTDVCKMLRDREPPNEYRMGTVPGDQMIGRAFFVYWPSGLRFSKDTMPVIPNVGRMRLIR